MMLREESEGTRRRTDDLPLETSLASSPTPLGRRTPSPSAAAAAAAGACHEGREPEAEPGGGRRLRGGGGDGRRRRPPRPPRAPNLARAVLSVLPRGTAAPSRPARCRGSFPGALSRASSRGAFGAHPPLPSCPPGASALDNRALQKQPPWDSEGGVVERLPDSRPANSPRLKNLEFFLQVSEGDTSAASVL